MKYLGNLFVNTLLAILLLYVGNAFAADQAKQSNQDLKNKVDELKHLPPAETCRRLDFEEAKVVIGIAPETWFLHVSGKKPWLNMQVSLRPLIYVVRPDYWDIEVMGCLSGMGLPTVGPYEESIDLTKSSGLGSKGVEVVGAHAKKRINIP